MSGHHVLTDHKGHTATIESEGALLCTTCAEREGRLTRLLLPRPADPAKQVAATPIPPRYQRPTGVVVPATSIPEWRAARERFGRKPTGEAS